MNCLKRIESESSGIIGIIVFFFAMNFLKSY